jgi:hypothetical protein
VNDKAPKNDGYIEAPSGTRLSKMEVVIGPNASGKTNLLKVLPFFKWLITDSFVHNPTAPIPVNSFAFGEKKNEPIELGVDFEIKGNVYTYFFILNDKQILKEELFIKNKTNIKVTSKKIFSREWNSETKKYSLEDKNFHLPKDFESLMRMNASIISTAMRLNHEDSRNISDFWQTVETNVDEAGWVGDSAFPNANRELLEALDFYSETENSEIKEQAEKLLSRFDLGLEAFNIFKEKKADGVTFSVNVQHTFGKSKVDLPLHYESSGTKQLLALLKTILFVLNKGGVAVLDEIDVNLHPDMVETLSDMFLDSKTNPKNAQLLFSTHSHRILNRLDKYQIVLVEKNKEGGSEAWRLDEMEGVRADDNYYTKYIAGAYGAIPNL